MKIFRIRKGDNVMVIAGKDADKDVPRKVLKIIRKHDRVLVEKTNIVKRHMRANPICLRQPGGIIEKRCQFIFQMSWSYVLHVINQRELDTGI